MSNFYFFDNIRKSNNNFQKTVNKIQGFSNLPRGWYYGEGEAPSKDAINLALKLNEQAFANGFNKTDAFPGINGEIQVTAYFDLFFIEMTIERNEEISYLFEFNKEEIEYRENLSYFEMVKKIMQFKGPLWALSTQSITTTTIKFKDDSVVSPSIHQVMEVEYPYLTKDVQFKPVGIFVTTSQPSIPSMMSLQRSSGKYLKNYFPESVIMSSPRVTPGINATLI